MDRMYRDTLRIIGLKFNAAHGVLPHEQTKPQPFEVDVEITLDLSAPAMSDCIEDTVNYTIIANAVRDVIDGEHHQLIEKLAGLIIERLETIIVQGEVTVRIRKPKAPLTIPFETVEVELKRTIG